METEVTIEREPYIWQKYTWGMVFLLTIFGLFFVATHESREDQIADRTDWNERYTFSGEKCKSLCDNRIKDFTDEKCRCYKPVGEPKRCTNKRTKKPDKRKGEKE